MKTLLALAAVTVIHDGEADLVGAAVVTGIIAGLIAWFFCRSKRPFIIVWVILWGGMLGVYNYDNHLREMDLIKIRDEAQRKLRGLPPASQE